MTFFGITASNVIFNPESLTGKGRVKSLSKNMVEDRLKISSLVPDLYRVARPVATGDQPLIVSGSMLHIDDIQMLPLAPGIEGRKDQDTGMTLYASLGGYAVLSRIRETSPKDYYKLLWSPTKETVVWIGSIKFEDSLDTLLEVFARTRFGAAIVDSEDMHTLITLREVVDLYKTRKLVSHVSAGEIGSPKISVGLDTSLHDVVNLMLERRVRRLFVDDDQLKFVSSRDVIRFLFSPERLATAKKNPEQWLDAKIGKVRCSQATLVDDDMSSSHISRVFGDGLDDCLVTNKGLVVTRWDIAIKPWKMRRCKVRDG